MNTYEGMELQILASLTSRLNCMNSQLHAPAFLPPRKKPWSRLSTVFAVTSAWWVEFQAWIQIGYRHLDTFLGAFAKLRKANMTFVMSVCWSVRPSVCPHKITRLALNWFSWNLISEVFSNICRGTSNLIKIWYEWWVPYMKIFVYLWQYLTEFFLEWQMFQTEVVEKTKKKIYGQYIPPPNIVPFMRWCEIYRRAREATDDDIMRRMRFVCQTTKARTQTHGPNT
jgi:hypothetical protein